ncbi:hypothetical protein ABFP60_10985 [Clostridioides difficile]
MNIRVKSKVGFLAQCFDVNNPSEYQNKIVRTSSETYQWQTIDLTECIVTQTGKELKVAIRTLTNKEI